MGYSPEHTERTRELILDSAAREFRTQGYEAATIDSIMAGAGLTRGGFYLHFRSKKELFAAYVGRELDFGRQIRAASESHPQGELPGAAEAIDYYLTPANRRRVARGCTIVANAADVARGDRTARKAFTRAFEGLEHEFQAIAARGATDEPDAEALAALATSVGGVVLARALADEELIERLLAACRRSVRRGLGAASGETT